jgi:hypothetical protein
MAMLALSIMSPSPDAIAIRKKIVLHILRNLFKIIAHFVNLAATFCYFQASLLTSGALQCSDSVRAEMQHGARSDRHFSRFANRTTL